MAACSPVGGQAVMDGVMMRNGDMYGLAVRLPDGEICAQRLPWKTFLRRPWLKLPFIRGFPILLETMVNGIHALNRSSALSVGADPSETGTWSLVLSLVLALLMAAGLFIAAPHLLSMAMLVFHLGGDVEGYTFHLWDGFYKCAIFITYIWLISFVPDIKRVFEYHGAEHKTINAWEAGGEINSSYAFAMSRLHPRCGTTFLLFVISISIFLQALLVPLILKIWSPGNFLAKHAYSMIIKLILIVPISAVSYELIRFAAKLPHGFWSTLLQFPGLALQRLTTREPSHAQIEVAIVALAEALESEEAESIVTTSYRHMSGTLES